MHKYDNRHPNGVLEERYWLHSSYKFKGVGTGFVIVEKIITKYSGKGWLEAALNKGASFFFNVPDEQ